MTARALTLLAALSVGVAGGVRAQQLPSVPQTLSLTEAIELSEDYSPLYRQTQNDRGAAAWGVRNAYAAFLPSLTIFSQLSYTGAGTQRFLTTEFRQPSATVGSFYNLSMNMQFNGNTLLRPGVQKAALSATDANVESVRMTLRNTIVQQYIQVLENQANVDLQERQVVRNEENRRLAQARFDVGQATLLDVRQAEVAKGQSDVALLQARQAVTVELLRLFELMGVPAPNDPSVVTLSDTFPIVEPSWELQDLLDEADLMNPSVLNLRAQETSAEWNERSVKSQWLPSLNLSAGWSGFTQQFTDGSFLVPQEQSRQQNNLEACNIQNTIHQDINSRGANLPIAPCDQIFGFTPELEQAVLASNRSFPFDFNKQPFSASVSVNFPIFDQFNRNLQVSQASAVAEDFSELRRARELQVRTDVSQQYYGLLAAFESVQIQENNRLAGEEGERLARERYRVGSGTFFELLDAQLTSQQAEQALITSRFLYHRTLAQLEAAVGRPLR